MSTPPGPAGSRERIDFSDGSTADLVLKPDGWAIVIDGVAQSHLGDPAQPPKLASIRWMLAALGDQAPRSAAHLGGALLALPRAVAHRWPSTTQTVVELEPALVELTKTRFPLPAGITMETADARSWLEAHPGSEHDAIVIDIFAGNRIPPAFTSLECMTAARSALREEGRLVLNSVAGPELLFTRRELATLRTVFEHVAMIVQGSALAGARFGNATLIASACPIDGEVIRSALAGDPSKGALVTDLDPIIDGASPISDADQLWSPEPNLPDASAALRLLEQTRQAVDALRSASE
ncbi:spermidine synthase [Nocardioides panzhihuensis]|uniref:Spermidine synthase n=1 Tax=Nocardioides panzhihuensis TaxID=860243 RepID=A0A7Z0IUT4_9ACTN|nr:fused MFS/spermidine synthase [Nocardioides panzhihuensis]NYI80554.1 spermidine synthase [Nocardioides panzhihuensis]